MNTLSLKTTILLVLTILASSTCASFVCPKQCICGATMKCAVKDLRQLRSILPTNITSLDLSSQGIKAVPDGAFENFTALRYLSLANNSIKYLSRQSLRGLSNLEELHLQKNPELKLSDDFFEGLPSLKRIHADNKTLDNFPPHLFNLSMTVNTPVRERIHCNLYTTPLDQCPSSDIPNCKDVKDLRELDLAKHPPPSSHVCFFARCKNKNTDTEKTCLVSRGRDNTTATCWGLIGQNTGVKLTLWTFGLLAVTSNLLVLITLLCNSEARRSPLCIFVMNLLLGNILIGTHIVIVTVADTVTYGDSAGCSKGLWEGNWCAPVFVVKNLGLVVVVLSLGLLAVERIISSFFRDSHQIDGCKAVGYVIESWLFAAIATIVLWTKAGEWGYLCSTYTNGASFRDIETGVKCSLVSICVVLICFYVFLLCWLRRRKSLLSNPMKSSDEYRTTVRMLLLLMATFFSWALPYVVLLLTVPIAVSETASMQTMAIALSLNACLHAFIYSFDNDDLENLHAFLSCQWEGCTMLPQDQFYGDKNKNKGNDLEMSSLHIRKSLELLSPLDIKSSSESETSARDIAASYSRQRGQLRQGFEVSKSQGAVIITNKSPTISRHEEETTVLLHSAPSSPSTLPREARTHDEHVSECGTISSDTNVTWLSSSDCPSSSPHSPNAHSRLGDGHSTISSKASSVHTTRSFSDKQGRKCLSTVTSVSSKDNLDERQDFIEGGESAKPGQIEEITTEKFITDENQNAKKDHRTSAMSPVRDILLRVLSPRTKKRPKTLEAIPSVEPAITSPKNKRSKSMLEGKDAHSYKVREDVLDSFPPVRMREKKDGKCPHEKRNGILLFRAGKQGLEIHEADNSKELSNASEHENGESCKKDIGPSNGKNHRDWERLATFLVIRPLSPSSKLKVNTKDRKWPKTNGKDSVKIYANPAASLTSVRSEDGADQRNSTNHRPESPTKRLIKLEQGDTLSALPHHLKHKRPNSTISTSSSSRLSKGSLDWDPTFTGDSYVDDDVMPPTPPPPSKRGTVELPPSPPGTPSPRPKGGEHVESVQVRLDPTNRYSLEWDPTGVQMRLSVVSHDSKEAESEDHSGVPEDIV